jgi:hypothetical protein
MKAARTGIIVTVAVLILIMWIYWLPMSAPVRWFCFKVPQSASPDEVVALANRKGFLNVSSFDEVMVLSQQGPIGRLACDVKFENNRQVSKEVIDAD